MEPDRPGASALQSLTAWLAARSAVLPPLPDDLLATVQQPALEWWETPPLDRFTDDPTDAALAAGASGTLDHFLLIGRSGRGYASYFFHVIVAEGPLVVVSRLSAPTAFDDELAGPELGRVLHAIGPLADAANAALERNALGDGQRFLVLADDRSNRYGHGMARQGVIDWHQASSVTLFEDATAALSATRDHEEF